MGYIWRTIYGRKRHKKTRRNVYRSLSLCRNSTGPWYHLSCSLLRNIKRKTQNLSMEQTIESKLTKAIALILGLVVTAYLPVIKTINIAAYAFINSTAKQLIKKSSGNFLWILIPSQTNAVINSVIYFARNSPMKRYYCKLLNCENSNRKFEKTVSHLSNS